MHTLKKSKTSNDMRGYYSLSAEKWKGPVFDMLNTQLIDVWKHSLGRLRQRICIRLNPFPVSAAAKSVCFIPSSSKTEGLSHSIPLFTHVYRSMGCPSFGKPGSSIPSVARAYGCTGVIVVEVKDGDDRADGLSKMVLHRWMGPIGQLVQSVLRQRIQLAEKMDNGWE